MLPPSEPRETTLNGINLIDTFGNGTRQSAYLQMQELEVKSHDALFVIMSDVLLDKPHVMEKLNTVFQGFEMSNTFPLFILMGSFTSKPYLSEGAREFILGLFQSLANCICSYPMLAQKAKLLIVPGPEDPGVASISPRRQIPSYFTKELQRKVPNMSFASNPCKLRFYTQEIVLFREDLLKKIQRHIILNPASNNNDPSQDVDITQLLAQSILDQAHLCPLPLESCPIYWDLGYFFSFFLTYLLSFFHSFIF